MTRRVPRCTFQWKSGRLCMRPSGHHGEHSLTPVEGAPLGRGEVLLLDEDWHKDVRAMESRADSRPRVAFRIPDGRTVPIIFDHGDVIPEETSFQLATGDVVTAMRVRDAQDGAA